MSIRYPSAAFIARDSSMTTHSPKVDFYVTQYAQENQAYHFIVGLLEGIYLQQAIFIYTESLANSKKIDDFLWAFSDSSFLAHEIVEEVETPTAPIVISHHLLPNKTQVLINLNTVAPSFYLQFDRIIEVIYADETIKINGRHKYRQYQKDNCVIETHHY